MQAAEAAFLTSGLNIIQQEAEALSLSLSLSLCVCGVPKFPDPGKCEHSPNARKSTIGLRDHSMRLHLSAFVCQYRN